MSQRPDLLTLGQILGGWCWVERQLFARLGAWSPLCESADATLLLDAHAQHAAWRSGQLWDRLPVLAVVDRDALIVAPSGWEGLEDADPGREEERLALAYRDWLPRLVVGYHRLSRQLSWRAEPAASRAVVQLLQDATRDWIEGEDLLQGP